MKRTATLFLLAAVAAVFFAVSPTMAGDDGRETTSRYCADNVVQCVKALKDLKSD